jgi:hypothetical protein
VGPSVSRRELPGVRPPSLLRLPQPPLLRLPQPPLLRLPQIMAAGKCFVHGAAVTVAPSAVSCAYLHDRVLRVDQR